MSFFQPAKQEIKWVPKKIIVTVEADPPGHGDTQMIISASAHKTLAVHPTFMGEKEHKVWLRTRKWVVTHRVTGYRVCTVKTESDAKRIAEYLCSHHASVFQAKTVKEIQALAQRANLIKWIHQCHVTGGWVSPNLKEK